MIQAHLLSLLCQHSFGLSHNPSLCGQGKGDKNQRTSACGAMKYIVIAAEWHHFQQGKK